MPDTANPPVQPDLRAIQALAAPDMAAVDALIRRGHSYGTIRRALDALSFDTEDFQEEF